MATRTVTGTIHNLDDTPWVNGEVLFSRDPWSYSESSIYPRNRKIVLTNNSGVFSTALWVNEDGLTPTRYTCVLPSGEYFNFNLPSGDSAVDIGVLRASESVVPDSNEGLSILAYVDAAIAEHNENPTAHPHLVSGGGGQPLDSDLTSIAALNTTSFGRDFLTLSDTSSAKTKIGRPTFTLSFTQANLSVANVLIANHNLGAIPNSFRLIDNLGEDIAPDSIQNTINSISVNLSSFAPITDTWQLYLGL